MDLTLIKLSLERLSEKVAELEQQNTKLKKRFKKMVNQGLLNPVSSESKHEQTDELLDTKEVLKILGISYNTLREIVRKKFISPIRINQRRVRYSKQAIYAFIDSRSH